MRRKPDQISDVRTSEPFAAAVRTARENPTSETSFKHNDWEHVILGLEHPGVEKTTVGSVDFCYAGDHIHVVRCP
jgi:hypothetical protein